MYTDTSNSLPAAALPERRPPVAAATPSAVPLTSDQVGLIQSTWWSLKPASEQVGQLFYQRLFELDPKLRPMFGRDLAVQARKLVTMLSAVVHGLERLDALLPTVGALGRRHAACGVQSSHYHTVGEALLWTLRRGLGPAASEPVIAAWTAAYVVLAEAMQAAAAGQAASS